MNPTIKRIKILLITVIFIAAFLGGAEIFQRIRYSIREGDPIYFVYGFPKLLTKDKKSEKPNSGEFRAYNMIPCIQSHGYRMYLPGDYTKIYKNRKFSVHINELGFRGEELKDGPRIVILGGSPIAGMSSPDDATVPYLLQKQLGVQVLNGGMGGRSMLEIIPMTENEILKLRPSTIILYSGFNNFRQTNFFSYGRVSAKTRVEKFFERLWAWLYNHSLVFASIYEKFTFFREKPVSFEDAQMALDDFKRHMQQIVDIAQRNGIRLVIVKQPLFIETIPAPLQDKATFDKIEDLVDKKEPITYDQAYYWMQSHILDIIDGFSGEATIVDPIPEFREKDLFHDMVHLTDNGNKRLAEIIARHLR